jgi:hypothetical protein
MPTSDGAYARAVRAALDRVKEYLAATSGPLTEADTRAHFIDPLIGALGYSGFANVSREVYVKDTKDRLDYVLRVDGTPRVGVEAKAIDHGLTDGDAGQLIQYCSVLGIEWAVLTNARQWWLYHQFAQAPLQGKLVFKLDLSGWNSDAEFAALVAQLLLVSRNAFASSDGPAAWVRAQKLDAALREALTNPQSTELKYLRGRLQGLGIPVTPEEIAAWAKAKLAEPTPALPYVGGKPIQIQRPETSGFSAGASYWLVPAGPRETMTALESLHCWLDSGQWGFFESTPNRSTVKQGDLIAFYATGKGIAAWARVASAATLLIKPEEWPEPMAQDRPVYRLPLRDVQWLEPVRPINSALRSTLDAFKGKKPSANWAWLVQSTHGLSYDDFRRLIGS